MDSSQANNSQLNIATGSGIAKKPKTPVTQTKETERMREFFHNIKRDSVLVSANADYRTTKPSYGFLTQHRLNAVLPVLQSRPHLLTDTIFSNRARPIQHPDSYEITLEMLKATESPVTASAMDVEEPYQKIIKFTN
ncbi:UNVERIFIED_CONTAM: hypothetical protein HDU68_003355, partial [Siphonaria sp. JEL0065]